MLVKHQTDTYCSDNRPFTCEVCNKNGFSNELLFALHVGQHTGQNARRCSVCALTFASNASLAAHRLEHTLLGDHSCTICRECCASAELLSRHMETHRLGYRCALCGFTTDSSAQYDYHQMFHRADGYRCWVCSVNFDSKSAHNAHFTQHKIRPHIQCEQCLLSFRLQYELDAHINLRHRNRKRFNCRHCGLGFSDWDIYITHIRTHVGNQVHECGFCEEKFSEIAALKRHVPLHVESGLLPYVCHRPECGKRFKMWEDVINHAVDHHPHKMARRAKYRRMCDRQPMASPSSNISTTTQSSNTCKYSNCTNCGNKFVVDEGKGVKIMCETCSRSVTAEDEINNKVVLSIRHPSSKYWNCHRCGRKLWEKPEEESPLCKVCDQIVTTTSRNLVRQTITVNVPTTVHEDVDRPLGKKFRRSNHVGNCNHCGQKFWETPGDNSVCVSCGESLAANTKDKPYLCPQAGCGQRFLVEVDLTNHAFNHHPQRLAYKTRSRRQDVKKKSVPGFISTHSNSPTTSTHSINPTPPIKPTHPTTPTHSITPDSLPCECCRDILPGSVTSFLSPGENKDPLQCTTCGQTFPNLDLMTRHRAVHADYSCPECEEKFDCKVALDDHLMGIHEWPCGL